MLLQERKKLVLQKRNVLRNKKIIFVFHMIFKLDCMMQITYFIIHICLLSIFSSHTFVILLYISLQETGHRKNTNPFLLIQVTKNQQNE